MGGGVRIELSLPLRLPGAPLLQRLSKVSQRLIGNVERGLERPTQCPFGQLDLLFTQGCAVSLGGVLFVGAAIRDVGPGDDERWTLGRGLFPPPPPLPP